MKKHGKLAQELDAIKWTIPSGKYSVSPGEDDDGKEHRIRGPLNQFPPVLDHDLKCDDAMFDNFTSIEKGFRDHQPRGRSGMQYLAASQVG